MNCRDIQRGVQVRGSEEQQRSALHVERRLHEGIDEIQSIRSLVGTQVSLQGQLRRLARTLRRQRHAQRSTELDVRFRRSQPYVGTDFDGDVLQSQVARYCLRRARHHLPVLSEKSIDRVLKLSIRQVDDLLL